MTTIRLAMIGSRGHHGIVLRELPSLPQVELVAVAAGGDTVVPLLEWAQKSGRSAPRVFDDHATMLTDVRPDAVVVCGPFERHASMCVEALDRGIHVYTEKPAALSIAELEQLRRAVDRNPGVRLVGMMQGRYMPGFYTAWQLVRDGAIGDVRLFNARKSYKLGKRPDYYRDRDTYGGTIPWVGSHAIDWIYWIASVGRGDDRAGFTSVFAWHSTAGNAGIGTMERSAVCLFTLESDRAATVSIDVFRPEAAPTHGDDWIRVVGSKGIIEARPEWLSLIDATHDGTTAHPVACDRTPFADFIADIAGQKPALIDARDTLDLTEACLLARQSADEVKLIAFRR